MDQNDEILDGLDFPVDAELSADFDDLDARLDEANEGCLVRVRRVKPPAPGWTSWLER